MRIFVSGCAGFIGVNFCNYILDNYSGDEIIGVDCLTYAANVEALDRLIKRSRFRFYKENICDAEAMERVFSQEKPDIVVNFAAESHVDRSIDSPVPFIVTNVMGTTVLLDAALKHNVGRFHQISTDEVYGDLPLDSPDLFCEDSPLRPSSAYSASKASADLLALSYMRTHGLPVSISRSTNNFGIYQHSEKLIPMAVDKLLSGKAVPVYGNGLNQRDWLHVDDHCRAVDMIIRAGECGIYNVGANNLISNIDLIRKIMTMLGIPNGEICFVADRKGHDRRYSVDVNKISSLGWTPEANFDDELKTTIEWYKKVYR